MISTQFLNPDGSHSHWSVCTQDPEGRGTELATGLMHDTEESCDEECRDLVLFELKNRRV